jgi:hypothetical protein
MRDKEAIAVAVTEALYEESPELIEKHGERGRQKTLQDMRYNIEHLTPAVDLGEPDMFAKYVTWLDDLLRARGVATKYTRRCLEMVRGEADARYDADAAKAIDDVLDAGLARVTGT